ncbi:MAG: MFS transporter, partial [Stackebrandtia sp.]
VLTAVTAAAFVLVERRVVEPALPLRLFRNRTFLLASGISLVIGLALFGTITYLPSMLQVILGSSAIGAGLTVTTLMGGTIITTILSGRLITRTGAYKPYPILGTGIAAVGVAGLAVVRTSYGVTGVIVAMVAIGLGVGLVMQVMLLVVQNSVGYADLGTATSSVTFLRQIGASAGVAAAGTILTWRVDPRVPAADAFFDAMPVVFAMMVPLLIAAFILCVALPARPLRTEAHVDSDGTPRRAAETP